MRKHPVVAIILILIILTFAAYWRVLGSDFVRYDDDIYVYANEHIQHGITPQSLKWAFNAGYACNWHPLAWISHMVDYRLFGNKPMGHHLVNLLLHIANTVLLLLILRRMTGSLWKSAFVAALFAVHPLHVESVAWVAERKDVLSTFFWLLTMGAYVLYAEKRGIKRYLPVVGLYALGLMAKPMLVTLPLALLLLDYWPLRRFKSGKKDGNNALSLVAEKLPLLALAIGSSALTVIAQHKGHAVPSLEVLPLGMRINNALVSYVGYIDKTLWPTGLAVFYPHPDSLSMGGVAGCVFLLVGFSVLIFRAARKRPYLSFGWLWYLVTLIPVIGVVQVGLQAMADRYTYIPLMGLFVLVAWLVPDLVMETKRQGEGATGRRGEKPRIVVAVLACLVIVVLAASAWVQVGYWRNSTALFERAIDVTEGNFMAHLNLGAVLAEQGDLDGAVGQYDQALEIRPDWDMAYYNLGRALANRGDTQEAIEAYQKALRLNPKLTDARVNLAGQLAMAGRTEEAAQAGKDASVNSVERARMHFSTGNALDQQEKFEEAIKEYQEAARLQPDFGMTHNNLAVDYYYVGNFAEAWREVHLARKYNTSVHPGFLEALSEKMPDPGG